MDSMSRLNDLARAEIDRLTVSGISLSPDEIVEINALAWSVETPETRRDLSRGRPVKCGAEWLWPPTLRSLDWLERNSIEVTKITPAIGYAMRFGRSEGSELDCEGVDAQRKVKAWYKSLRVTPKEYRVCVEQVDEFDATIGLPTDPDGKQMTIGDFSAFLAGTCGADADFWERRCSATYCASVLTMIAVQNHAAKEPCARDPRIVAEIALGRAIDRIRKRHADNG